MADNQNVKITFNADGKNLIATLNLLDSTWKSLNKTASKDDFAKAFSNIKKLNVSFTNLTKDGNRVDQTFKSLANSTSKLSRVFNVANISAYALADVLAKTTTSAISMVETANLFSVSLGTMASEADNVVQKMSKLYGLDVTNIQNAVGTYALLARSMGMSVKQAKDLAINMTQLAIDYASLTNVPINQVLADLKAGLVGQSETVYKYGLDVTEAGIKQEALAQGITKSVRNMTQGEKMLLRYSAMLRQSGITHGDFAKTINTPANQLKILSERLITLGRTFGTIFIPMLEKVLPYLNAFVMVITEAVEQVAILLGYRGIELPEFKTTGLDSISASASEATDALNETSKSIKKLQKNLVGIDEINTLSNNSNSNADSGVAGASIITGYKLGSYDNLMSRISQTATKLTPKIKKMVNEFKKFIPVLAGIATIITTKKIIGLVTGVVSAIAGLASSPAGVVALAIGGLVALGTGIYMLKRKIEDSRLEKRFGDIALSAEEVEEVAQRLVKNKYSVKIETYMNVKEELEGIKNNISQTVDTLNKLNWKAKIGLKLTPDEIETYKQSITDFINQMNNYIAQKEYAVSLAIDIIAGDDEAFKNEMTEISNRFFGKTKTKMAELGRKLREEIEKAFADGELSPDEAKVIANLQQEMAEIQQRIDDAEFKAKLSQIVIDGEVSAKSFKNVMKRVNELLEERLEALNEQDYEIKTVLYLQMEEEIQKATEEGKTEAELEKIKQSWEEKIKAWSEKTKLKKVEIQLEGISFSFGTLEEKFKDRITGVEKSLSDDFYKNVIKNFIDDMEKIDTPIGNIVRLTFYELYGKFTREMSKNKGFDSDMKKFFEQLKPTQKHLTELSKEYLNLSSKIPDSIIKGLNDTSKLGVIAKDVDSMFYLIGQKLAQSPEYMEMLKNTENIGKQLPEAVLLGIKSKVPSLNIASGKAVFDASEVMKLSAESANAGEAGEILIKDLGYLIQTTSYDMKPEIKQTGIDIANSLSDGTTSGMDSKKKTLKDKIINIIENLDLGDSPFNNFKSLGKKLIENLAKGLGEKKETIKTKLSELFDSVEKFIPNFKFPKIEFSVDWKDTPEWLYKAATFLGLKGIPDFKFGIKKYALGGIFTSPHIGMIGEAGAEAVVPLENNLGWIDKLAEQIVSRTKISNNSTNDRPVIIQLMMDRRKVGEVVVNSLQELQMLEGQIPI